MFSRAQGTNDPNNSFKADGLSRVEVLDDIFDAGPVELVLSTYHVNDAFK